MRAKDWRHGAKTVILATVGFALAFASQAIAQNGPNTWSEPAPPPGAAGGLCPVGSDFLYATLLLGDVEAGGNWHIGRYTISGNVWTVLSPLPAPSGMGLSLAYPSGGDYIYVLRGEDTTTFWRYVISTDSWETLAPLPMTRMYGGALVYPGTGDYLYALRGYRFPVEPPSSEFWRYSITNNSWETLADTPFPQMPGTTLAAGPSGEFLYAFRGGDTREFWRYRISTNSWEAMASTPAELPGVERGAVLCYPSNGDYVYACLGGYTCRFLRYSISGNSWTVLASLPGAVWPGSSMAYPGGGITSTFPEAV